MQDPRKLLVYQRAHTLAVDIRRTTKRLSRGEYASLRSQMVRAVESVVLNIAEGCGASSQREFARFLDISIKSTTELECQLDLTRDYAALDDEHWRPLHSELIEIRRMLCGLRRTILSRSTRSAVTSSSGELTN
jgi:four helix bundle protein